MKRILAATTAIVLIAGAAAAATDRQHERPDLVPGSPTATGHVAVLAGSLDIGKELTRAGLSKTEVVDVTAFPTGGMVDRKTRSE